MALGEPGDTAGNRLHAAIGKAHEERCRALLRMCRPCRSLKRAASPCGSAATAVIRSLARRRPSSARSASIPGRILKCARRIIDTFPKEHRPVSNKCRCSPSALLSRHKISSTQDVPSCVELPFSRRRLCLAAASAQAGPNAAHNRTPGHRLL